MTVKTIFKKKKSSFFSLKKGVNMLVNSQWYATVLVACWGPVDQSPSWLAVNSSIKKITSECFRPERSDDRQWFVAAAYISIMETDWFLIWFCQPISCYRSAVVLYCKKCQITVRQWNEIKMSEDVWDKAAMTLEGKHSDTLRMRVLLK